MDNSVQQRSILFESGLVGTPTIQAMAADLYPIKENVLKEALHLGQNRSYNQVQASYQRFSQFTRIEDILQKDLFVGNPDREALLRLLNLEKAIFDAEIRGEGEDRVGRVLTSHIDGYICPMWSLVSRAMKKSIQVRIALRSLSESYDRQKISGNNLHIRYHFQFVTKQHKKLHANFLQPVEKMNLIWRDDDDDDWELYCAEPEIGILFSIPRFVCYLDQIYNWVIITRDALENGNPFRDFDGLWRLPGPKVERFVAQWKGEYKAKHGEKPPLVEDRTKKGKVFYRGMKRYEADLPTAYHTQAKGKTLEQVYGRSKTPQARIKLLVEENFRKATGKARYFDPTNASFIQLIRALDEGLSPEMEALFWNHVNQKRLSKVVIELQILMDKILTQKQARVLISSYERCRANLDAGLVCAMHEIRRQQFRHVRRWFRHGTKIAFGEDYNTEDYKNYGCEAISEATFSGASSAYTLAEERYRRYLKFTEDQGFAAKIAPMDFKLFGSHGLPRDFLSAIRRLHVGPDIEKDSPELMEKKHESDARRKAEIATISTRVPSLRRKQTYSEVVRHEGLWGKRIPCSPALEEAHKKALNDIKSLELENEWERRELVEQERMRLSPRTNLVRSHCSKFLQGPKVAMDIKAHTRKAAADFLGAVKQATISEEAAEKFKAQFGITLNHTFDLTSTVTTLTDVFRNQLMPSVLTTFQNLCIKLVSLFWVLISPATWDVKLASVTAAFSEQISVPAETIREYSRSLAQVFQGMVLKISGRERFVAQSGFDGDAMETVLVGTIKLLGSIMGVKSTEGMRATSVRVRRLKELADTVRSLETLGRYVITLIKYAYWTISEGKGIRAFAQYNLSLINDEIPKWMEEVVEIDNPNCEVEVEKDYKTARKVLDLKRRGDDFCVVLHRMNVASSTMQYFNQFYNRIRKLASLAVPHHYNDVMRISPFVIHLWGGAGVGKSTLQLFLIKELMEKMGLEYNHNRDKYVRNTTQDHWDGYRNQPVVVFDDFLQSKIPEHITRDYIELIHCKNTTPYPLKMANLEAKGCTRFTSELMVLTSNEDIGTDVRNYVANGEAVRRRRDIVIKVSGAPGHVDSAGKLKPITNIGSKFRTDVYEFEIEGETGTFCYNEMITICKRRWHDMRAADQKLLDQLKNWHGSDGLPPHLEDLLNDPNYFPSREPIVATPELVSDEDDSPSNREWRNAHNQMQAWRARVESNEPDEYRQLPPVRFIERRTRAVTERFVAQWRETTPLATPEEGDSDAEPALTIEQARAVLERHLRDIERDVREASMSVEVRDDEGVVTTFSDEDRVAARRWSLSVGEPSEPDDNPSELTWRERYADKCKKGWNTCKEKCKRLWEKTSPLREKIALFSSSVATWCEKIYANKWFRYGIIFLEILAVGFAVFSLVGSLKAWFAPGHKAQGHASGDYRTYRYAQRWRSQRPARGRTTGRYMAQFAKPREYIRQLDCANKASNDIRACLYLSDRDQLKAEGTSDPNCFNLIGTKIRANLVRASCGKFSVNGLFLRDNILALPQHMLPALEMHGDIRLQSQSVDFRVDIEDIGITKADEYDLVLLSLPRKYGMWPDIVKHFVTEEDLSQIIVDRGVLVGLRHDGNSPMMTLSYTDRMKPVKQFSYEYTSPDGDLSEIAVVKGFRYNSTHQQGDCGSPLLILHNQSRRKIIGIHLAGSETSQSGFSNQITQEMLESIIEEMSEMDDKGISLETEDLEDPTEEVLRAQSVRADDQVDILGIVSPARQYRSPDTSQIRPSPLNGMFAVTTKPSMLRPCGDINPMRIGIKDQFVNHIIFPEDLVVEASQDLFASISSMKSAYRDRSVLTDHEALNGIIGDPYIRPLNLKSSPGYPYIKHKDFRGGKKEFLNGDVGDYSMGSELKERYMERLNKAKTGVIPVTYFCDVLKDERRPIEKVDAGKTRVFNSAPFDLNILVRKYFLPFIAHLEENHIFGEVSVGINPHSSEWTMLFKDMQGTGDKWIAGDYSKYDKRLPYQLCMAICDIVCAMHDDQENDRIRYTLFKTMFNSVHLCGRVVYKTHQGNPSGIPLTVIVNSLVNALLFRIAFLGIGRRLGLTVGLDDFHKWTNIHYYGDDNVGTINSAQAGWFNMESISTYFKEFGIIYTPPSKGDVLDKWIPEEEVTYLKRRFVTRYGRCMAPLPIDVIREMMMWYRDGNGIDEAMEQTFGSAMREMIHHGKDAFNKFQAFVIKKAANENIRLSPFNFNILYQELILGGTNIWRDLAGEENRD